MVRIIGAPFVKQLIFNEVKIGLICAVEHSCFFAPA